ncbi:response regulator transcription factor [Burkholderia sp. BCC0405]|uniref:response regulator transcription factor n=1 Tax=Burkholderia sp. BCC0405 TaxID=2676298 RepID=UPI00158BD3D2|nr:response regulator transcription factor [Burkholderia sp. BCC0405]
MVSRYGSNDFNGLGYEAAHVVILNSDFPDRRGLAQLPRVRQMTSAAVVVMASYRSVKDECLALSMGADEYLYVDVDESILIERIKACLRRQKILSTQARHETKHGSFMSNLFEIDDVARKVHFSDGTVKHLTTAEFDVLMILVKRCGLTVGREELMYRVFGRELIPGDRAVDGLICKLKKKLYQNLKGKFYIHAVRGKGYMFVKI